MTARLSFGAAEAITSAPRYSTKWPSTNDVAPSWSDVGRRWSSATADIRTE
jgi:hypothetical protein